MFSTVKKSLFSIVLVAAFVMPAAAQEGTAKPNLYLLAVGISEYKVKEFSKGVTLSAKDARDIASFFKSQEGKMFEHVDATVLTNEQGTRKNIEKALADMKTKPGANDYVVVFLSGHGGPDSRGQWYMLMHDTNPILPSTSLYWTSLRGVLANLPGKRFLMLDSCHSGSSTGNMPALKQNGPAEQGLVTMASSMGHETSWEFSWVGNGVFTKAVIEGLSGKADMNKDGVVTLAELDAYISERVPALTKGKQHSTMERPTSLRSNLAMSVVNPHTTQVAQVKSQAGNQTPSTPGTPNVGTPNVVANNPGTPNAGTPSIATTPGETIGGHNGSNAILRRESRR